LDKKGAIPNHRSGGAPDIRKFSEDSEKKGKKSPNRQIHQRPLLNTIDIETGPNHVANQVKKFPIKGVVSSDQSAPGPGYRLSEGVPQALSEKPWLESQTNPGVLSIRSRRKPIQRKTPKGAGYRG